MGEFLLFKKNTMNGLIFFALLSVAEACSVGSPFLYVTVHDEIKNVVKYTRDGCKIQDDVLVGGPLNKNTELRSLYVGLYNGSEALYVANAYTKNSGLYVYGPCDTNGGRSYLQTVVSTASNSGAVHTYGVGADSDGNIYASFQHTDNVLRFYKDSFIPMPLPAYFDSTYPDGTFFQFGAPGIHKSSEQGVRCIVEIRNYIWIANEDINAIQIVSVETAQAVSTIDIVSPIGLFYDSIADFLYVGSKNKNGGAVYSINTQTLKVDKQFVYSNMTHPTGIVVFEDTLIVGDQDMNAIISFNISSGLFIKVVSRDLPGSIEQLALSPC